ncbi:hypothetical protein H310_00456 [Aphanomyces invadans]|uniref:Uncharacterized protein n=1 Tax=Aphanomyces invadans TaxID=157072 RepID=A0A024UVT7_9STRA|nr:hypothetical protein H310_00456 [Aphanomyces invadans]ETW10070.1 hypothetical protein H310_00456 [Aphanomyces invadans]|eukprot:XP_008861481.1 hypothetical protein H310_00456 [Aphanomyces invadans]
MANSAATLCARYCTTKLSLAAQVQHEESSSVEAAHARNEKGHRARHERFWDHLLQWQEAARNSTDSRAHIDLDTQDLERSFGPAFAQLYMAIVAHQPWMQWASSFIPFLPSTSADRKHFNVRLQRFFDIHGRAMWEQYFWTGSGVKPCVGPSQRFVYARAEMGLLIYDLYQLEGVAALVFLDGYPHPSWPSLLLRPVHLKRMENARLYVEEQHTKRWPDYTKYQRVGHYKIPHDTTAPWPAPCASFIQWAAGRSKGSCAADAWLETGATPEWFASVLNEMKATAAERCVQQGRHNDATCPYICVMVADHIPPHWKVPDVLPSKWVWDATSRSVVECCD